MGRKPTVNLNLPSGLFKRTVKSRGKEYVYYFYRCPQILGKKSIWVVITAPLFLNGLSWIGKRFLCHQPSPLSLILKSNTSLKFCNWRQLAPRKTTCEKLCSFLCFSGTLQHPWIKSSRFMCGNFCNGVRNPGKAKFAQTGKRPCLAG